MLTTAREESTVTRVTRRSRAVWKPDDWKLLQTHGYGGRDPRIVTFEVRGSVFFGSSVQLLQQITGGLGLSATDEETKEAVLRSPGPHRGRALLTSSDRSLSFGRAPSPDRPHRPPQYVVLDLSLLTNLDASAARGSFVQLAKMCGKRGIVICATGANPRVEWMMRSHEVSYGEEEEEAVKASLLKESSGTRSEKVLLFLTIFEGLEFCENLLVKKMAQSQLLPTKRPSFVRLDEPISSTEEGVKEGQEKSLSRIFAHILDLPDDRRSVIGGRLGGRCCTAQQPEGLPTAIREPHGTHRRSSCRLSEPAPPSWPPRPSSTLAPPRARYARSPSASRQSPSLLIPLSSSRTSDDAY